MRAVTCPVCKGEGLVCVGTLNDGTLVLTNCHGCEGLGWVVIPSFLILFPLKPSEKPVEKPVDKPPEPPKRSHKKKEPT